jgi:hypothetical protein
MTGRPGSSAPRPGGSAEAGRSAAPRRQPHRAFSIDQNCHPLWDVLPKVSALSRHGWQVRHFIEDVDVAFSAPGAEAPPAGEGAREASVDRSSLRLALERYHRSGGADWGAALFYSEFLGRQPVELRDWEPLTGMKTNVLARRLGRSVDDLYDELSPGDNWQLIGSSYVGDREHHRLIGDLTVAETQPFLREIVQKARADAIERFPAAAPRQRLDEWFARETQRLERLLAAHAGGRLVELYRAWLGEHLGGGADLDFASALFAARGRPRQAALLEVFTRDYPAAAELYNQALGETHLKLRPLRIEQGELPFFATFEHHGHRVRAGVYLAGGELHIADPEAPGVKLAPGGRLPLDALAEAGVACLTGKAVLLAIQARLGDDAAPLAVPRRGSAYLAASHRLAAKLADARLLPEGHGPLHPVLRVRFRLLDRIRDLHVVIRLPAHLAAAFGREEITAAAFADGYADLAREAWDRLASFESADARGRWQRDSFPEVFRELSELDSTRRRLAKTEPKGEAIRNASKRAKALEVELLEATVRQIAQDWQVAEVDFWDSRGALLPWCVGLGGEAFYHHVVEQAEIREEGPFADEAA